MSTQLSSKYVPTAFLLFCTVLFSHRWNPLYLTQARLVVSSTSSQMVSFREGAVIQNLDDPSTISDGVEVQSHKRKPMGLVAPLPLILPYHNGPVLAGPAPIKIYLLYYGSFTAAQKQIIRSFINSFNAPKLKGIPTVSSWWSLTSKYTDRQGGAVSQTVLIGGEASDAAESLGKSLTKDHLLQIVLKAMESFPSTSPNSFYLVLTAADVSLTGFCQNVCGQHLYTYPSQTPKHQLIPYGWVGNSATQCPGFCAWPFAKAQFGPNTLPLLPPNGDVGIDGMIISIAKIIAGAATDPYGTAYYQGDASAALEAAGSCTGAFGDGSYPGYPGKLLENTKTGASFNVQGLLGSQFLVPWIWNPATLSCAGQPI